MPKADNKIYIHNLKKKKRVKSKLYHIENSKDWRANCVDLVEVAHNEPPHLDLHCLQILLFSSLVLKELISGVFFLALARHCILWYLIGLHCMQVHVYMPILGF